jgi:ATP-dependent DNA helicase RecG
LTRPAAPRSEAADSGAATRPVRPPPPPLARGSTAAGGDGSAGHAATEPPTARQPRSSVADTTPEMSTSAPSRRGPRTAPAARPLVPGGLERPVESLTGVGPQRARKLREAGLATVGQLLTRLLPVRFEDRRHRLAIADLPASGTVTVQGEIRELRRVFTRRRGLTLLRGRVADASGELPVVWFNRPYLLQQVVPEAVYRLHGPLRAVGGGRELLNPSLERVDPGAEATEGAVVPIYPQLGDLPPAGLRKILAAALASLTAAEVIDPLPAALLRERGLPDLFQALHLLHAPSSVVASRGWGGEETSRNAAWPEAGARARSRLVYGELFAGQLELALVREALRAAPKPHRYRVDDAVRAVARRLLPFRLTAAQRRVVKEIVDDLCAPQPMLRLLQGDVGAGKTIVAALAMLVALESGLQTVVLAPTELLAEQHHRSLERLLGERHRGALLTSARGSRSAVARATVSPPEAGGLGWVVGTHALLEEGVRFARLGLVVVDEQHRFGVAQRQRLQGKGARPDVLVMTATPIPRSLALALHGDLDLSLLDELPPGRHPVQTELLSGERRSEAWSAVRAALAEGGQAYVVVPRISEGGEEGIGGPSLDAVEQELGRALGGETLAIVHGRQDAEQRRAAMAAFASGTVRVLLATTVIEVGVDVPAATLMVIDGAERFGLAQLHQLRGRVGRGGGQARCLALLGDPTPEAEARLAAFVASNDGFALAEADLALRGPGEVLGTRQAGASWFTHARLPDDQPWLELAREDARRWRDHPSLAALRAELEPRLADRLASIQGG